MQRLYSFVIIIFILAVVAVGGFWTFRSQQASAPSEQASFFADSTPLDGSTLPASPTAVVLNFTSDVTRVESFTLQSESGEVITSAEPLIDELATTVRLPLDQQLADGSYRADFTICFGDEQCQEGSLEFAVDRAALEAFTDLRGQPTVSIDLDQLAFNPANVIVSPGTTVTWKNLEGLEHYVNTDTHPYHTYEFDMNSRKLNLDDEFSHTFEQVGAYPYHCSAHADVMAGTIVVDDGQDPV